MKTIPNLLLQTKYQYKGTRVKLMIMICALYTPNVFVCIHITVIIVMIWLMYKEIVKPPASIVRSLNLVMYFGCQLDEPYGFPGDHQPDATML